MLYRFAAACSLIVELLAALHFLDLPLLHQSGPLAVTGAFFILAFVTTEARDCLSHFWRSLRGAKKGLSR